MEATAINALLDIRDALRQIAKELDVQNKNRQKVLEEQRALMRERAFLCLQNHFFLVVCIMWLVTEKNGSIYCFMILILILNQLTGISPTGSGILV